MAEQCPSIYPDSHSTRCEREQFHQGQHVSGKGAFRKTWGGKVQLGGKTLASRQPKEPAPPKAAPHCRHCLAPEVKTEVKTGRTSKLVSNLEQGQCKDRAACEDRAPSLFPEAR